MKTINVTQEDIDRGMRQRSRSCPIALAASRAFEAPCSVGLFSVWKGTETRRPHTLPEEAVNFVRDFDQGKKVKPFSFEV